jgi:hypothetical protein
MVGIETWDVEGFRKRIQAMTDEQLIRCGKAARYMRDSRNSPGGKAFEPIYDVQLTECIAEWRRRHPKTVK